MRPKQTHKATLLQNPWFSVERHTLIWPSGFAQEMNIVVAPDFSIVVAVRDGEVLLVEQYRHTAEKRSPEFPMGGLESKESPVNAARRELQEETGIRAGRMQSLGTFYPAIGRVRSRAHVFFTEDILEQGEDFLEYSEEDLKATWIPIDRIESMVDDGRIECAASIVAWEKYRRFQRKKNR